MYSVSGLRLLGMAVIVKVQAQWNGFQGAPGYTNWYGLSDGDSAAAANALGPRMRIFFFALAALIPVGATVKVQRLYQVLDSITGHITSESNLAADPAVVTGTAAGNYAAPVGAVMNWETGLFNDAGHRVRGRSYLVPLTGCCDADGSLSSAAIVTIGNAGTNALGGTGGLGVWSRPRPKGASNGVFRTASGAVVHDKACVLRSRRD
jgi:hypothetical protein